MTCSSWPVTLAMWTLAMKRGLVRAPIAQRSSARRCIYSVLLVVVGAGGTLLGSVASWEYE